MSPYNIIINENSLTIECGNNTFIFTKESFRTGSLNRMGEYLITFQDGIELSYENETDRDSDFSTIVSWIG